MSDDEPAVLVELIAVTPVQKSFNGDIVYDLIVTRVPQTIVVNERERGKDLDRTAP